MNIQALKKQIKITDILNIKEEKNEFFICSPLRAEKTPSFKINQAKNIWYDFGTGEGGSVLDLILKIKNCTTKEAVEILKNYDSSSFSFSPANIKNISQNEDKKIELKKITELINKALISYVESRKINVDIAKKYLKDVYFSIDKKNYFGLGFKNDLGGFEIRNKYVKMCLGKKSITTLRGKNSYNVAIFEGFMDFLSAITYYKKEPKDNVIVLNSLSLLRNLDLSRYDKINLFLDRDEAGIEATKKIKKIYKNVKDYSTLYTNYKDFNDFLLKI